MRRETQGGSSLMAWLPGAKGVEKLRGVIANLSDKRVSDVVRA